MDVVFNVNGIMLLQLIVGALLPLLVGLVTKFETRSGVKAVLLIGLNVVTALLTELLNAVVNDQTYDLGAGLFAAIMSFVVSVALQFGVWRPTGATEKVQALGSTTTPSE